MEESGAREQGRDDEDDVEGRQDAQRPAQDEKWIDENFIRSVWFGMGESVNVKMIRDKFSG